MDCPMCLEPLGREKVILPCHHSHAFHKECIVNWQKNCPVCRSSIPPGFLNLPKDNIKILFLLSIHRAVELTLQTLIGIQLHKLAFLIEPRHFGAVLTIQYYTLPVPWGLLFNYAVMLAWNCSWAFTYNYALFYTFGAVLLRFFADPIESEAQISNWLPLHYSLVSLFFMALLLTMTSFLGASERLLGIS